MGRTLAGLVTLMVVATTATSAAPPAGPRVDHLRCEYLANPLGVDVPNPRLSWAVSADARGEGQTAYQVLVASSPENLASDQGDLWDSGQVRSGQSTFVEYQGQPLASGVRCHWKVRVWDRQGHA